MAQQAGVLDPRVKGKTQLLKLSSGIRICTMAHMRFLHSREKMKCIVSKLAHISTFFFLNYFDQQTLLHI